MTTTPTGVKLPITGEVVPADAAKLTIKETGRMIGREGYAFSAEVYDGKTLLGTITDEGNGGGAWFRHHTSEARDLWETLVAEYAILRPEWAMLAHESLAGELYEEVALFKDMNRKRNMVARLDQDPDQILVFNVKLDERGRDYLRSTYGDRAEVWIKGKGWEKP